MQASDGSAGIGARLKEARERSGLSVIEAAERLHVDSRAVESLEAERFEEFGASVYVRGHLGHYAQLVGESPAELQALYAGSSHVVRAPDLTKMPHVGGATASPAPIVPGIAIVAAVAVIGFAWWIAGSLHAPSKAQQIGPVQAPVFVGQASARAAPITQPPATHPPVDLGPGGTHPIAVASTESGPGVPGAGPGRRSAEAHASASALQLHFTEDSWAEVYDARGERLLFDVGPADSTRTVSGMAPLRVVLGNPTGVALELNGRPVSVPESATRNVSIEFQINRSGRVAPARLAAVDARAVQKDPGRD